ncbi:structural maintenance of chromosomes protein 4-like isoform X2 [Pecten maximus]|uniref:structural maintenance of chromosomes protein 4-like isoform X1 n=1 Tax=Pecten maximus TaxID=6579 RepID=UPI0014588321|nr:structural maintenance of chromosomes protein 4-like isoform X1 [Pecten maximus]XP_033759959.1 structural maintenance of chromosomes protein 4-like isoform X2 [Pecten maximus]
MPAAKKKKGQKAAEVVAEPMEVVENEGDADPADGEDLVTSVVSRQFNPEDFGEIEIPPAAVSVATYEIHGPRLMITHIVNENFKSYAGTQTLGPFHKSFTSIIGPNGSGKSNVIDSMLFVFGFRANKIRSKKISVLIHNSENHTNIQGCTVSVHFQKIIDTGPGDDEYTVVPDSKFVVARTAFKDNSSYYTVDGKRQTYKEVAMILRGSGIDLDHNRFLILQGEVEQIAMMKPKGLTESEDGMLEFLEDIIGSNRFKEPIDLLAKRVETLNEMRGEKLNRVKAVEKEKDDLEGSKNEAVEFLSLENEIIRHKNKLYQKYVKECAVNEEKATGQYNKINEGMKEVNEKMQSITDAMKEKGKEHKRILKQYEQLVVKGDEAKERFSEFEKQDVKCREDMKHTKSKAKKLEKTLEQEKTKVEEFKAMPEQTEQVIADHRRKLERLEKDKKKEEEKLAEVMEGLKTETKGLQEEKEKKEEELLGLQKSVNDTKSKLNIAQSELDIYLSTQQSETSKLEEMQRNLNKACTTVKDRQSYLKDLKKKLPETENVIEKAKKDMELVTATELKCANELRSVRTKVEEARSSMQAAKRQGKVIEALMEAKKRGVMPGVCGRLGDLGAIDMKYDVAISTACGALDHIVVDSINTAQQCVQFLKKNNIGSATFIGLDKMAKWKEHTKRKISPPENVPRLFDLVKTKDDSYLPAFYFALRDTLVANDLEQATRIAYGKTRYRVVTLQGQLIDQSGTMSGGGKSVCKGRMGSAVVADVDPKELNNLENSLEKLANDAQQSRANKERLEDLIREQEKSLNNIKHTIEKCEMDIKAMSEQETNLTAQIKEQEARVKAAAPDEKELKQLEKKVGEYKKEYEKASGVTAKIEKEVQRLHNEIMDIGGSKMQAVQCRVDAVSNQIDQVTGQITKAQVALKTTARNLKKAEEKVESVEEEIEDNKKKIAELDTLFKQLEEDATSVLQNYQGLKDKIKEADEELSGVKAEIAKHEEEQNQLQKEVVDVRHELEKFDGIIKSNQQKIKHWKKEMGQLTLTPIEGKGETDLPTVEEEELATLDKEATQYEITVLEEKLAQMKPNMAAIAEYRKKETLYLQRVGELDQITDVRDQQRKYFEDLRKQRLDEFMAGFSVITNKLKEMYQMITLGGDAELELVDSLDPFSEGIVFSVRPPKKSWKNISNLSGGEKTLSSLALVFALHHYKPTPLYVMDEIDAALDFKNVSIVANYIKERTKNAQFIIISLRNNMFELADRLVGIYKTDNCTKSVTINPNRLTQPLSVA